MIWLLFLRNKTFWKVRGIVQSCRRYGSRTWHRMGSIPRESLVPGLVVESSSIDPVFVASRRAHLKISLRIGSGGVPKRPRAALHDLSYLLRDNFRWRGMRQGRGEESGHAASVRINIIWQRLRHASGHRRVDNAGLDDGHMHVEQLRFLVAPLSPPILACYRRSARANMTYCSGMLPIKCLTSTANRRYLFRSHQYS